MPDDDAADLSTDGDIAALYAGPRDEFVTRRNALAKERGDPRIRDLGKPTVAAWAVNATVAERSDEVEELIEAGEAVRSAQRRAMSGKEGAGAALREANEHLRDLVGRLTADAVARLDRPGAHEDDVRATFQAAAMDEAAARDVRAGRLERPLEAAGFGTLAGLAVVGDDEDAAQARRAARQRIDAARAAIERLDVTAQRHADEARTARAEAEELRARARAADERAEEAERRAAGAEREADGAREELAEAERRLDEL